VEDIIARYAFEYSELKELEKYEKGEINANNPIVFLFVGDNAIEGLPILKSTINSKWHNSDGVVYFCIGTDKKSCQDEKENTYYFNMGFHYEDFTNKEMRKNIYDKFYSDEDLIKNLNNSVQKIKNRVLELGKVYSSAEHVTIAVITRVDDPLNVLLPEFTLLLKYKFAQDYKMIIMDLYNVIKEKAAEDSAYFQAVAMSYFREIEYFQSIQYEFEKEIEVLSDDIKSKVSHSGKPIFDLVYLLSDKNEGNILLEEGNKQDYEIIAYINILKNRKPTTQTIKEAGQKYNNAEFMKNVSTPGKVSYVSAGLSKVKKPDSAIASAVLYHYINRVIFVMSHRADIDSERMKQIFGIDDESIKSMLNSVVTNSGRIGDMFSIMSTNLMFNDIKKCTFKDAEDRLYSNVCEEFFNQNCESTAWEVFEQKDFRSRIKERILDQIIRDPKRGMYCAYEWTKEEGILAEIVAAKRSAQKKIEVLKSDIESLYSTIVMTKISSSFFVSKKKSMQDFKCFLFDEIYKRKLELLRQRIFFEYIKIYEDVAEEINQELKLNMDVLKSISNLTKAQADNFCRKADDYIGQNIMEYYAEVVKAIDESIMEKRGEEYYYEDKFFGNFYEALEKGEETFLEKLISVCKKHILNAEFFNMPFEKELLERANVKLEYESKAVILSKEDLFKKLYEILEENAKVNIYLFEFIQKIRHEEKYFFGNKESEFINYAFKVDETSIYKLGCVDEKRNTGIDKLNLIGGFHIEDMVYAKNCMKYYNAYVEKEFQFHGIDKDKLPIISEFL
jgi:hypothetical protein